MSGHEDSIRAEFTIQSSSFGTAAAMTSAETLGALAELELEREEPIPIEIDFGDWRARGSGGPAAADLIDEPLAARPTTAEGFRVTGVDGARRLHQRYCVVRWRRPA